MITSSMHILSPYLAKSLSDYRAQVDRSGVEAKVATFPSKQEIIVKQEVGVQAGMQERRDVSRQASIQALEIKHTQSMIDTYIDASTKANETPVGISSVDPVDVYRVSQKYSRRADLMSAFEEAIKPQRVGVAVNIVV